MKTEELWEDIEKCVSNAWAVGLVCSSDDFEHIKERAAKDLAELRAIHAQELAEADAKTTREVNKARIMGMIYAGMVMGADAPESVKF